MQLKKVLKKAVYGAKSDSESYVEHLKAIGMKIGDDCIVYVPTKTLIDEQYP